MRESQESLNSVERHNLALSWLGYGAQILTLFLALAIIAGRIYTQRYWSVFGLAPDFNSVPLINYAIASPDVAVASLFIAVGTTATIIVVFIKQRSFDTIGSLNPRIVYTAGCFMFFTGIFGVGLIARVDLSSWAAGTVGLVFGISYFVGLVGVLTWVQAALKLQKEPLKPSKVFQWLKKIPPYSTRTFFVAGIFITSLWGIFETAWQFGSNEAKFMYNTKPMVSIQLESPTGFEDFISTAFESAIILRAKIIEQDSEFLYVSPGLTGTPQQLHILAIPVSRVEAIRYDIEASPIGK